MTTTTRTARPTRRVPQWRRSAAWQLGVMAAWSVVLFAVATKTFRWSR